MSCTQSALDFTQKVHYSKVNYCLTSCVFFVDFYLVESHHIVSGAGNELDVCAVGLGVPLGLILALLVAVILLLILIVVIVVYKAKREYLHNKYN